LDRIGFAVEDRDRSSGIYFVRYSELLDKGEEEEGFLSKLAFWADDEKKIDKNVQYRVKLKSQGEGTQVVVRNQQGKPASAEVVETILGMIHEQIR
jgi:outer membrane protein assembly factor BamC